MAGCCGNWPLPQQRKCASCYGNERRSVEKLSSAQGSDSWSGQSVETWGWCWRTGGYHRGSWSASLSKGCCPSHSWRTCVCCHRGCLISVCCGGTYPRRDWGSSGVPSAWSSRHPPAAHTHCPVDSHCQPLFWDWVKEQSWWPSCGGCPLSKTCP